MHIDLTLIPNKLKNIREAKGLTQIQAATLIGISQGQVSHYEMARSLPGLEILLKMVEAYGTTLTNLLEEKEPSTSPPRHPSRREMALWVIEAIGINGFELDRVKIALQEKPYKL